MPEGINRTFDLLAHTPNAAAVPVLVRGLDSADRSIAERALRALLHHREPTAAAAVLERWHVLPDHCRLLIREKPGWLGPAIRSAVLGNDDQLYRHGCEAALLMREYELASVLVGAAEDQANPFASLAAETTLQLAELLYDELHSPRDYRNRRDPALVRAFFLSALEKAVGSYVRHRHRELLESFVLLAGRENPLLRHILQSPHEREFPPLAEVLVASPRPGVIHLLLHLLEDPLAPTGALKILSRRKDLSFLRQVFRAVGEEPGVAIRNNLRRMDSIAWLPTSSGLLRSLGPLEQAGAVQFAAHSQAPRDQVFELVEQCLLAGEVPGRRAAAEVLGTLFDPRAGKLIERGLSDDDPQVRAFLVPLLRTHAAPRALEQLVEFLRAPEPEVQEATRRALAEYEFSRYLAVFDQLTESARQSTGRLVRQVDPQALAGVSAELRSETRIRRRRGLELVLALGAVNDLAADIGNLLKDDDPYLRVEAVRVLAADDSPAIRQLLREALLDPHPLVHQAAEETLAKRTRSTASPRASWPSAELPLPASGAYSP